MKKCIYLLLPALFLLAGRSAVAQEIVYLQNGSVIKGSVIEQVPNESIKIQTKDGSIFVYRMSEVERIAKETKSSGSTANQDRHKGLDFNAGLGYHIGTKKGSDGTLSFDLGLGKRFSKHFYWGIGTGLMMPTGSWDPIIPVTSDFRLYFPLQNSSLTPGGIIRLGYGINTAGDQTFGSGKTQVTVEATDNILIQIQPTLTIPISERTDFNVGVGYTHMIAAKGGGSGSGAVTVSAGFNFGKPMGYAGKEKPQKPTIDRGIQLSFEVSKVPNSDDGFAMIGLNLAATYKLNPKVAFGAGLGYDWESQPHFDAVKVEQISAFKFFLRGQYKFLNKRITPFVALDAGLRFFSWELRYNDADTPGTSFYVAPGIGVSARISPNSYLELKGAYDICAISKNEIDETYIRDRINISSLCFTLGFTHTFNWGSKWFK